MTPAAKKAIGEATVEYLVLVLPVAFYVGLEAYHKLDPHFFYKTVEWAIATIFLQFQGLYLFLRHLNSRSEKLSEFTLTILSLLALTIIAASAMNALDSMHSETGGKVIFRLMLFAFSSLLFALLAAASRYKKNGHT